MLSSPLSDLLLIANLYSLRAYDLTCNLNNSICCEYESTLCEHYISTVFYKHIIIYITLISFQFSLFS